MDLSKFLSAEWHYLAMLNYEVEPAVLEPYVPPGTELDRWQGKTFLSMVGFLFLETRVLGIPIPFHTNFEEVNLRFYVRHQSPEGWRRGVVFIKELVPKYAIATVAQLAYNENYAAVPMRHTLERSGSASESHVFAEYGWQFNNRWHCLSVKTKGKAEPVRPGSEEEFITEHYWGYATQRDGGCVEYQVEHPSWLVWPAGECNLDCDVTRLYGEAFASYLQAAPSSAFLAKGSAVVVRRGVKLAA